MKFEPFFFHSNIKLPKKLKDVFEEAKKESNRYLFPVLVMRDDSGNQYDLTIHKDKNALKYLEKFSQLELLCRLITNK